MLDAARSLRFSRARVGVVSLVAVDQLGCADFIEQRIDRYAIGHLAAREKKSDGTAISIGQSMDVVTAPPRERPIAWLCSPLFPPGAHR